MVDLMAQESEAEVRRLMAAIGRQARAAAAALARARRDA
jgi:hypothetical protein